MAEAVAAAEEALQRARAGQFRREEALAQRALGLSALMSGEAHEALDRLRVADALLEDIGATLEVERTRAALAGVLAVMGR